MFTDGLENTRQYHADNGAAITDAAEGLTIGGRPVHVDVLADSMGASVLGRLDETDYAAAVFASNALRHPESDIVTAVRESATEVGRFLSGGRGIVFLHQYREGPIGLRLPNGAWPALRFRSRQPLTPLLDPGRPDHAVLNFPHRIEPDAITSSSEGQLASVLSWMRIESDSAEGFEPLITSAAGDWLVAQSKEVFPWRVALSAIPLDWHRSMPLLRNLLRYAAVGAPQVALWAHGERPSASRYVSPSIRSLPGSVTVAARAEEESLREWLLRREMLHIFEESAAMVTTVGQCTDGGAGFRGIALSFDRGPHATISSISGLAGDSRPELARRFFESLAAISDRAIQQREPYPRRNVITAISYFHREFPTPGLSLSAREFAPGLLAPEEHFFEGMTVTSVLASVQTIIAFNGSDDLRRQAQKELERLADDSAASRFAAFCLSASSGAGEEIPLSAIVGKEDLTSAEAIRVLDWLGFATHIQGLSISTDEAGAVVHRLLSAAESAERNGIWMSLEGSANVVMGVSAALDGRDSQALYPRIGRAVTVLRSHIDGSRVEEGRSVDARVFLALATVESRLPSVLNRLAQELPRSVESRTGETRTGSTIEQSQLANRNVELRNRLRSIEAELQERTPLVRLGTLFAWLLFAAVLTGGVFLAWWTISILPGELAFLSAAVAGGWVYILTGGLRVMDTLHILPNVIGRPLRALPLLGKRSA
ncbi:hypothetical protein GCM10009766_13140 [Microcella frigidaquae]